MDFLALVLSLELLIAIFRWSERWLHQHIFKVGWLTTNNFQTTTVLYYIIFLPGIVLHEISLWLAAGVLNVRAERAIQFPQEQDIGDLRLHFVRVAAGTGSFKRLIIAAAPSAAGAVALWGIASHIFDWQLTWGIAASGDLDDLARALTAWTRKTDFWLWVYLAFTIANTIFPAPPARLRPLSKLGLAAAPPLLALAFWGIVGAADPAVAEGMEKALGSLGLVTLQITGVNLAVVIALGSLEAIIERLSGRSATFRGGKMLTRTRGETQQTEGRAGQDNPTGRAAAPKRRAAQAMSIYELKLPIPGPPGREPVSRSVAAVFNLGGEAIENAEGSPAATADAQGKPGDTRRPQDLAASPTFAPAEAKSPPKIIDVPRPPPKMPKDKPSGAETIAQKDGTDASGDEERAPFSRPFVIGDRPDEVNEAGEDLRAAAEDEPFARPFAMAAGSEAELDQQPAANDSDPPPAGAPRAVRARNLARRTKPAPKPSQREPRMNEAAGDQQTNELSYGALDEGGWGEDAEDSVEDAL